MFIPVTFFIIYINCSHFGDGQEATFWQIKWKWIFFKGCENTELYIYHSEIEILP